MKFVFIAQMKLEQKGKKKSLRRNFVLIEKKERIGYIGKCLLPPFISHSLSPPQVVLYGGCGKSKTRIIPLL